jgi:hypothetical protein
VADFLEQNPGAGVARLARTYFAEAVSTPLQAALTKIDFNSWHTRLCKAYNIDADFVHSSVASCIPEAINLVGNAEQVNEEVQADALKALDDFEAVMRSIQVPILHHWQTDASSRFVLSTPDRCKACRDLRTAVQSSVPAQPGAHTAPKKRSHAGPIRGHGRQAAAARKLFLGFADKAYALCDRLPEGFLSFCISMSYDPHTRLHTAHTNDLEVWTDAW